MRPLLAPQYGPESSDFFSMLLYPMLGSPKIDGIRGLNPDGFTQSRTGKELANRQVQQSMSRVIGLDAEITDGDPFGPFVMNDAQSFVRSRNKVGDCRVHVFDYVGPGFETMPFYERLEYAHSIIEGVPGLFPVKHEVIENYDELIEFENKCLAQGYEGVMLRNPMGRYKHGRATMEERIIWKMKRFTDVEMVVVAVRQGHHNLNAKTTDELGYAERSSHKANLVPSDMCGGYVCLDAKGKEVLVAPGSIRHPDRRIHLAQPELVVGLMLTVRYFGLTPDGEYRHPRAVSFRYD